VGSLRRRIFHRVCILTTPFFVGLNGFRSELWRDDPVSGEYDRLYRREEVASGPGCCERLVKVLRLLSARRSVSWVVGRYLIRARAMRLGPIEQRHTGEEEGPNGPGETAFGPGRARRRGSTLKLFSRGAPMSPTHERRVHWSTAPRFTAWRWMLAVAVLIVAVILFVTTSRRPDGSFSSSTRGSGVSVTERRDLPPFTSIELAGTDTVVIHVGETRSVAVVGDDNLVERVTTADAMIT
jgi:hypothetical protein